MPRAGRRTIPRIRDDRPAPGWRRDRLVGVEEPARGDQPRERARRVRPAAEPDDEDAVAYLVVARDERVAAHDPRDQAGSADSPEDLRQEVVGIADAVQVLRDLLRR